MNYLIEIKSFNEWLETNELSTSGIVLWYGLMYIANRSGWRDELLIPISAIELRTHLSRSSIYRARVYLRDFGLIEFDSGDGRQSCIYRIYSFESRLAFHADTQSGTQTREASQLASHCETQTGTQTGEASQLVVHCETQSGTIYKHKQYIDISRDKDKKNKKRSGKKGELDLSFIEDVQWRELIGTWLEYKKSRDQNYKSELSVRKFLSMLKNLSKENFEIAQKIIDKSIANNWAGIFELHKEDVGMNHPAKGQRIGQIKQPEDEERRQKLLDKFGRPSFYSSKNSHKNTLKT